MKVAIVSHAYVEPGYSPVLESMAACPGIQLALITPDKYRGRFQRSPGAFENQVHGLRTYALPIIFGKRQGAFLYGFKALSRALDDFHPDLLLHEQEVYSLGAAQIAAAAKKRSIPLVMFVWENLHRSLSWPRRRNVQYVLGHCAGLIAGSTGAEQVHRDWGYRGKTSIIPQMGIPLRNPSPFFGRRNADSFSVCFAGRLVPEKGIDCLLRAIALVRYKGIRIRCNIAGNGPDLQNLTALRDSLGIADVVDFKGRLCVEEVRDLLAKSDALVLPSRKTGIWEEQFGLILIEAMSEATVTIGSRTGAIPEVIGSDALLFGENDHQHLAVILERLASNNAELAEQQQRLWNRVDKLYTNDILAVRRATFLRQVHLSSITQSSQARHL
jgi:glycosyltransferase involved in cell wall biosynthesis